MCIGIAFHLYITLGGVDILTMLILPVHEHHLSFCVSVWEITVFDVLFKQWVAFLIKFCLASN